MSDKQVTVAVPEERVAEFYAWSADFLTGEARTAPRSEWRRHGHRGRRLRSDASAGAEGGDGRRLTVPPTTTTMRG
ncbi:MAG: hypothetical protein ACTHQQ_08955, partial [Solirubrobacteraceae bacterium]